MKVRGAMVQGALAAFALGAAYFAWQREPVRFNEEVVVLDVRKSDVTAVRFDDAVKWSELKREGEAVWVTTGKHPPPPPSPDAGVQTDAGPADAGAPDAGAIAPLAAADAGVPPALEPPRTLRGNDLSERTLERFAPLRATRALGTLSDEKLRELGLSSSPRRVDVTTSHGVERFRVSAVSPTGGAPYLMSEKDQRVYLIPSTLISDLEAAGTRLVDRRLHPFRQGEYDRITLRVGDVERTFVQSGTAPQMTIAPATAPESPDEFAKNWLDKVYRLVPTELLGRDEPMPGPPPEIEVRVEYAREGEALGHLELARGPGGALYARTGHTAGWVKVQLGAREVLDDAERLISAR